MLEKWEDGYDIVYTRRKDNKQQGGAKRMQDCRDALPISLYIFMDKTAASCRRKERLGLQSDAKIPYAARR